MHICPSTDKKNRRSHFPRVASLTWWGGLCFHTGGEVQPSRAGFRGEVRRKAAPGPPGCGLAVGLRAYAQSWTIVVRTGCCCVCLSLLLATVVSSGCASLILLAHLSLYLFRLSHHLYSPFQTSNPPSAATSQTSLYPNCQ